MHVLGETLPHRRDEDTKNDDSLRYHMRMVFFRQYKITGSCILSAKYSWESLDNIRNRDSDFQSNDIWEDFLIVLSHLESARRITYN